LFHITRMKAITNISVSKKFKQFKHYEFATKLVTQNIDILSLAVGDHLHILLLHLCHADHQPADKGIQLVSPKLLAPLPSKDPLSPFLHGTGCRLLHVVTEGENDHSLLIGSIGVVSKGMEGEGWYRVELVEGGDGCGAPARQGGVEQGGKLLLGSVGVH